MTKLKKNLGLVPLSALCLVALAIVVLGGAAAFAQRQLGAETGRPEIKVLLSGAVEREGKQLALDKVAEVHPGEILQWQITTLNEGHGFGARVQGRRAIPAGTAFVGERRGRERLDRHLPHRRRQDLLDAAHHRAEAGGRHFEESPRPRLDVHGSALRVVGRARRRRQALRFV